MIRSLKWIVVLSLFVAVFPMQKIFAAGDVSLNLSPSTGTFVVDSTFDVSLFLDTQAQSINAVELTVKFAPDRLQLISSSTGKSIIGIWPTLPKFNNETGVVQLVGGVPGGITASRGLITTLTFRAKAVGSTVVKIESSRVLFNDGSGTEALVHNNGALYQIVLPPPAGPIVVSSSHPEQGKWYRNNTVNLEWGEEGGLEGFSYMISDQAIDTPDDIAEGTQRSVVYHDMADGKHYFHIKGLRAGQWGGVSHYAVNIDTTPPADFKVEVIPGARTARTRPVIQYQTTDSTSGVDHYELSMLSLQDPAQQQKNNQSFFIEAESPYIPGDLSYGKYDVIIRAFDLAGNVREVTQRIQIVPALFQNVADKGLVFKSTFIMPWWVIWTMGILVLLLILFLAFLFKKRHDRIHSQLVNPILTPELETQLMELQKYRERYGKTLIALLACMLSLAFFAGPYKALAQTKVLNPPFITTVPKNISNEEIFYVGGHAGFTDADVVILLENEQTGETYQETVRTDDNGDWFYQHNGLLSPGNYLIWAQTKFKGQVSPPSPQVKLLVEKTALHFGSAKLSYTSLYLLLITGLLLLILILVLYILYHHRHTKKKQVLVSQKLSEAENSIRRGFVLLNRDLQAELLAIRQTKSRGHTIDERLRQEQIMKDLEDIEQYLSKEIWELERAEQS
jgi:hypothetical protein